MKASSYNRRNGGPRNALAQDPTVSQLIWGFKFMLGMEGKKNNFPCTLRSWLRPPCKKTDWPIYICLLICISHGYRKDTQEKLPNPQITQPTTLNTSSAKDKRKVLGKGSHWRWWEVGTRGCCPEEQDKQRQGCDAYSSICLLRLVDSHPPLPGTWQQTQIQMEISFINANVP